MARWNRAAGSLAQPDFSGAEATTSYRRQNCKTRSRLHSVFSSKPKRCSAQLKRYFPIVTTTVLSLIIGVLAWIYPGIQQREVDLNDGGVWVTSAANKIVAHLNYPSDAIDAQFRTESDRFDISQAGEKVYLHDQSKKQVAPVNTMESTVGTPVAVKQGYLVEQAGDSLAALDPKTGNLWVSEKPLTPSEYVAGNAQLRGYKDGQIATRSDGVVFAVSPRAKEMAVLTPQESVFEVKRFSLPNLNDGRDLQISGVGKEPIAYQARSGHLYLPNGKTVALTPGLALQMPGPDAEQVILAGNQQLIRVSLTDGKTREEKVSDQNGNPARPVVKGKCLYGAWAKSGTSVRICNDKNQNYQKKHLESLAAANQIVFRQNRNIVVLNEVITGMVWLADKNMRLIDDWQKIDQQLREEENQEDSPSQSDQIAKKDRKDQNSPPQAHDDNFGVRAGRSTTLPVLDNDSDTDGDLLVASVIEQPAGAIVTPIRGGQALQIQVPGGKMGDLSFTYQAQDGRGGTDTARVTVSIHPQEQNGAPLPPKANEIVVLEQGKQLQYNSLTRWRDPDGDAFYLYSAAGDNTLQVDYREEGGLLLKAAHNAPPGIHQVALQVSDGREQTTGYLSVDIRASGNLPPEANGDFVQTRAGYTTTIRPLANDTDPNGDPLQLVSVQSDTPGVSITQDAAGGSFSFSAPTEGIYYLTYVVSDGPANATGVIRVDVTPKGKSGKPLVEDDLALLPENGQVLVNVLGNDSDPSGDVLVVQNAKILSKPAGTQQLEAVVVSHNLLSVSANHLEQPAVLEYTAHNGLESAKAQVTVVPIQSEGKDSPPIVKADEVHGRTDDVVIADVLNNDRSLIGLPLSVDPKLQHNIPAQDAIPFVTNNQVRIKAKKPGTYKVTYTAKDTKEVKSSTTVTFQIKAADASDNTPPEPRDQVAQAIAGMKIRIPIDLNVDPDGDWVTLIGPQEAPQKGSLDVGSNWISYTPNIDSVGTDSFTYLVEDKYGAQGVARVHVGIAPPSAENSAPKANDDEILVRPQRNISVGLIQNDNDPDGDPISVVEKQVKTVSAQQSLTAKIVKGNLVLDTPEKEEDYAFNYTISDGRGGQSVGKATVHVRSDAPLRAPLAQDDLVTPKQVGLIEGKTIDVDVLANDVDPDGNANTLKVSCEEADVKVDQRGHLKIPAPKERRVLVYRVKDQDGLEGAAVVDIPGVSTQKPTVDPEKTIETTSGAEINLDLEQYVIVRRGRQPYLATKSAVSLGAGFQIDSLTTTDKGMKVRVAEDFWGETAITLKVSDGAENDATALTASISIPVKVKPVENKPPRFTPTNLRVGQGEPAQQVDLASMVTDPAQEDPHKMRYRILKRPSNLEVSLSGSILSVSAPPKTNKGAAGKIEVEVLDDSKHPVTGAIPVEVTASSKPLISITPIERDTKSGELVSINVENYASNPFPGKPLKIVGSPNVRTGEATVNASGTTINIQVAAKFHGNIVVGYTLVDETEDPDRQVNGTITLHAQDKPNPPAPVTAKAGDNGEAIISWPAPDSNGAPITHYQVKDLNSGKTEKSPGTQYIFTGLKPGEEHSFEVTAVNQVGESAPAKSNSVLIELKPGVPTNLKAESPGPGKLEVTWGPPANNRGSEVTYDLTICGQVIPGYKDTKYSDQRPVKMVGENCTVTVKAKNKLEGESATTNVLIVGKIDQSAVPDVKITGHDYKNKKVTVELNGPGRGPAGDEAITCGFTQDGQQASLELTADKTDQIPVYCVTTKHKQSASADRRVQITGRKLTQPDSPRIDETTENSFTFTLPRYSDPNWVENEYQMEPRVLGPENKDITANCQSLGAQKYKCAGLNPNTEYQVQTVVSAQALPPWNEEENKSSDLVKARTKEAPKPSTPQPNPNPPPKPAGGSPNPTPVALAPIPGNANSSAGPGGSLRIPGSGKPGENGQMLPVSWVKQSARSLAKLKPSAQLVKQWQVPEQKWLASRNGKQARPT